MKEDAELMAQDGTELPGTHSDVPSDPSEAPQQQLLQPDRRKRCTRLAPARNAVCFVALALALVALAKPAWQSFFQSSGPYGSCAGPIQLSLRWGADRATADHIACHNSRFAEHFGYWELTSFPKRLPAGTTEVVFYDSVNGDQLFVAPRGRSWTDFIDESRRHGWPSFRKAETNFTTVKILFGGEMVSRSGTHLGHNLPDGRDRYCINLVSVAGTPVRADR